MCPYSGKPHPVGERHAKAPKGTSHWNKSAVQFRIGANKYQAGD